MMSANERDCLSHLISKPIEMNTSKMLQPDRPRRLISVWPIRDTYTIKLNYDRPINLHSHLRSSRIQEEEYIIINPVDSLVLYRVVRKNPAVFTTAATQGTSFAELWSRFNVVSYQRILRNMEMTRLLVQTRQNKYTRNKKFPYYIHTLCYQC